MRIVLVAGEAAGLAVFKSILNGPHEIVAVFSSDSSAGPRPGASIATLASRVGYEVLPAEGVTDPEIAQRLNSLGADVLLNVHSLYVIHPAVLGVPGIGSFNLHPGPLPRYAGLNAPSWAVYNAESRHAVTLHWLAVRIDTGPIAYEDWFDVNRADTGLTVSTACARKGVKLVDRLLSAAAKDPGAIPAIDQDLGQRRFFLRAEVPFGGRIPWSEAPETIVRLIRACDYYPLPSPWGYAWTEAGSQRLEVIKVRQDTNFAFESDLAGTVIDINDQEAWVATSDGAVVIERMLVDGRIASPARIVKPGMQLR